MFCDGEQLCKDLCKSNDISTAPIQTPFKPKALAFCPENVVELMYNEKQRKCENFNFKSVASVACPYELTEFLC